jgi:hypothetical protein
VSLTLPTVASYERIIVSPYTALPLRVKVSVAVPEPLTPVKLVAVVEPLTENPAALVAVTVSLKVITKDERAASLITALTIVGAVVSGGGSLGLFPGQPVKTNAAVNTNATTLNTKFFFIKTLLCMKIHTFGAFTL